MKLRILQTPTQLSHAVAENFVELAHDSIARRGRFMVAFTGGRTPKQAYHLLADKAYAARVDWSRVHVFWGDERCVPPEDEASNFRMAREALLDHIPLPAQNVHRMKGEDEPGAAAAAYEQQLDEIVGPRFDLIHLGMGADAHIASLFPGGSAFRERRRRVCAEFVKELGMWRLTLTPAAINQAAHITFIVAGAEKADAVAHVLEGPYAFRTGAGSDRGAGKWAGPLAHRCQCREATACNRCRPA